MNGGLWQLENKPRLRLIGNPENRRVRDFQQTAIELGFGTPPCLSYLQIIKEPGCVKRSGGDWVRIDSPGENEMVARELIRLGGGPADTQLEFGEIGWLQEYHLGFCKVLKWIEEAGLACMNAPSEIAVMFDKWECHQRFRAGEVIRPPARMAERSFPEFWKELRRERTGRVFLKPLHGSSGSGVCALRWMDDRVQMITSTRLVRKNGSVRLFNSLVVQTYSTLEEIELVLSRLLPQGMIVEEWIPKFSLAGGVVDLRVLVIGGEARHWVVRQSKGPITNLHLGNNRGEEANFTRKLGEEKLSRAFRLAERAASLFPGSFYAGVDILLDPQGEALVGEINAFGDLLPRLRDRGESAYEAIIQGFYDQSCAV